MSDLLPVEEALSRLLALGAPVEGEELAIDKAGGRWTAGDIRALRSQPGTDLSAMDGYALRFADLPGPLRVVGESAAGAPFEPATAAGEAVRIFTGAALPAGADTILVQEEARREGDLLRLSGDGPPAIGAHVRRAGEDFRIGDRLIAAGERLTPARIGLAVAAGHARVPVSKRVRVAIVSTGDELKPAGSRLGPGEIPASNGPMLAAQLSALPVAVSDFGIVRDDMVALRGAIDDAAETADIIVTIGGASVGAHDLVRPAFEAAGAGIDFWRVAMKPGKPLMAGRLGAAVALGLPGNPVSAFVTAKLFLEPLVRAMSGDRHPRPRTRMTRLAGALPPNGRRVHFVSGRWEGGAAMPLPERGSASQSTLAEAELLIKRDIGVAAASPGEMVEVFELSSE